MLNLVDVVAVDCLALIASYLRFDEFTLFTTRCVGKSLCSHRALTLDACYSRSTHLNSPDIDQSFRMRAALWQFAISRWNDLFQHVRKIRIVFWSATDVARDMEPITSFTGTLVVGGAYYSSGKNMKMFPNTTSLQIVLGCNCDLCCLSEYFKQIQQFLPNVERVEILPPQDAPCKNIYWNTRSPRPATDLPSQMNLRHLRCRHIDLILKSNLHLLLRLFPELELIEDSWSTLKKSAGGWRFNGQVMNSTGSEPVDTSYAFADWCTASVFEFARYQVPEAEIRNAFYFP